MPWYILILDKNKLRKRTMSKARRRNRITKRLKRRHRQVRGSRK